MNHRIAMLRDLSDPTASVFRWFVCAIALLTLGGAPAAALSPPPCRDLIRRCPQCDVLLRVGEHVEAAPMSGNDQPFNPNATGRRYRSDASWTARSIDQRVALCPVCKKHFWRRDAELVGEPYADDAPTEWRKARSLHCRAAVDWNAAIGEGLAETAADLRYLRLHAWWGCNDDRCLEKDNTRDDARRNLEEIVALLDATDPADRLLRAEALRELGRFEDAEKLLQEPVPPVYEGVRTVLLHHVARGDSRRQAIPGPCQPTRPGGPSPACRGVVTGNLDAATERANSALLDLVDALIAEPQLTKTAVERIAGRALDGENDLEKWRHYESAVHREAVIERVRLRQPPTNEESRSETAVILEIGGGSVLTKKDVDARYGVPDKLDFQVGPSGAAVSRYDRGQRSVTFVTNLDDNLVEDIIVSMDSE